VQSYSFALDIARLLSKLQSLFIILQSLGVLTEVAVNRSDIV
jgi:hypothetical protein